MYGGHCCHYNADGLCVQCGRESYSSMDEDHSAKEMCCRTMKAAVYQGIVDLDHGATLRVVDRVLSIELCPWCGGSLSPYVEYPGEDEGQGVFHWGRGRSV